MKLTPRLYAISELIPRSLCMADIGTDHAYIPISLIRNGKVKSAIAGDIHAGPAQRARTHIAREGLSDKIEVREGSGLEILKKGEVEGAVIAGMGGLMIRDILAKGSFVTAEMKWLVLQPQNHIPALRTWLQQNEYKIDREVLVEEGAQLYEILYITHGYMEPFSEIESEIGVTLSRYEDRLFIKHLHKLIVKRQKVLDSIDILTANKINMEKYKKATAEKEVLEGVLWRFV